MTTKKTTFKMQDEEHDVLKSIARSLERIAEHLAPDVPDIVGTTYVAKRLGCTVHWIGGMVRKGVIPKSCIVAGTGGGKVWRFHRKAIEAWIKNR